MTLASRFLVTLEIKRKRKIKTKTKAMEMNGKRIPRVKIINNKIIDQVTEFIYLGRHLSQYNNQKDIDRNLTKYNTLNESLKINFGKQMRK